MILLALALFSALPGASPQDPPADPESRIVIEGRQVSDEEIRDLLHRVRPSSSPDRPLDRLIEPLCLAVRGMEESQAGSLVMLIEARAREVGLEIAGEGCRTNALVVISNDNPAILDYLGKTQPGLFVQRSTASVRALMVRTPSSVVWATTEVRGSRGERLAQTNATAAIAGDTLALPFYARINQSAEARRLGVNASSAIISVTALVDADALSGLSLFTIADHLALRLLAPSLDPLAIREDDPPTILSTISTGFGPSEMGEFDRAYLEALYGLPLDASPNRLRGAVMKALAEAED